MNRFQLKDLGLGVGLRTPHYDHVLTERPAVDWFEILSENYLDTDGRPRRVVDAIAAHYPIAMHGVSMSLGGTDPLDRTLLKKLKDLADRTHASWMGDHICWTGVHGQNNHDLLPLPLNERTLRHLAERVRQAQDLLERPLVLENASTYVTFASSNMPEEEFVARLAEDADCALLLDVNNVYVSCRNHGWDPLRYLEHIPYDRVVQIHLAGHTEKGTHAIDTHKGHVIDAVWALYAEVIRRAGPISTLVEWDQDIPDFDTVHAEVQMAAKYRDAARTEAAEDVPARERETRPLPDQDAPR